MRTITNKPVPETVEIVFVRKFVLVGPLWLGGFDKKTCWVCDGKWEVGMNVNTIGIKHADGISENIVVHDQCMDIKEV